MPTSNQAIRTSSTVGTIPTFTALSGGTATSDANNAHGILYTGTDVLTTSAFPVTGCGAEGSAWLYCATGTPKIARVMGIVPVDLTNPAALVYSIILDRTMTGLSGTAINYIVADLKKYSVTNDGGASGTFDGVALLDGETVTQEIQYPLSVDWLEAKTFDATGTSFLITETK